MTRQRLEYKRKCLNCMQSDGLNNIYFWKSEKEDFDFRQPKPSHEFEAIYKLKKELSRQQKSCEFCSSKGKFDIWDFKIDSESIYTSPSSTQPTAYIIIDKINSVLTPRIEIEGQVTILLVEEFINASLNHLKHYPDDMFISKKDGFLNAILFFDLNTFNSFFNRFRFAGLNKDEIKSTLTNYKNSLMFK